MQTKAIIYLLLILVSFLAGRATRNVPQAENIAIIRESSVASTTEPAIDKTGNTLRKPTSVIPGPPTSDGTLFLVSRVIDGDTIQLSTGERVRYIGIDTPETVHPSKSVQCFGHESSSKNKELVEGKLVRLERDVTDKDRYGRLLRYVYQDNLFVNLEMVRSGYATVYTYPPDITHAEEFRKAELGAREAIRGLWGACR